MIKILNLFQASWQNWYQIFACADNFLWHTVQFQGTTEHSVWLIKLLVNNRFLYEVPFYNNSSEIYELPLIKISKLFSSVYNFGKQSIPTNLD